MAHDPMMQHIVLLLVQYGLAVVFFNVLIEQAGLPVPAVPVLVVAGALGARGQVSLAAAVVVAGVACLIADSLWFLAGRRYGEGVMRILCRISLSPDSCVRQSELRFQRWRGAMLLVAKFVPGLSTVAPPLVGAMGLRLSTFLILDAIGALLWVGSAVGLGYLFAPQIDALLAVMLRAGSLALQLLLFLLALYLGVRYWKRRRLLRALDMERISVGELAAALASDQPVTIVDVRSAAARALDPRILPGAVFADARHPRLYDIPLAQMLVTYCNCPNEVSAALAARYLRRAGFRDVRPLAGGLDAWLEAGLPMKPDAQGQDPASTGGAIDARHG